MPQWMKRPNLASRHHFILASCCSLVSAGAAAGNAESRQAPTQMMRITNGITLCFTIAFLWPGTAFSLAFREGILAPCRPPGLRADPSFENARTAAQGKV